MEKNNIMFNIIFFIIKKFTDFFKFVEFAKIFFKLNLFLYMWKVFLFYRLLINT